MIQSGNAEYTTNKRRFCCYGSVHDNEVPTKAEEEVLMVGAPEIEFVVK